VALAKFEKNGVDPIALIVLLLIASFDTFQPEAKDCAHSLPAYEPIDLKTFPSTALTR